MELYELNRHECSEKSLRLQHHRHGGPDCGDGSREDHAGWHAADAQGIFVFRNAAGSSKINVFQLDATTPLAFVLATQFTLHPQDVIFVVTDPATQWNAVIAALLPSISAIRGVQVIGGGA